MSQRTVEYNNYLKSDEWASVRLDLFAIRGKRCERCGKGSKLHIHHKTYKNFMKEEPEDLEILCEDCHKKEHGQVKKTKEQKIQDRKRFNWNKRQRDKAAKKARKKSKGIEGKFVKVNGVLCRKKNKF